MRQTPARRDLTLEELLILMEANAFGLPDFQRRFRWGPDQVRSLLATVFMGWPAGLILLMEAPPTNFFALRSLEGLESRAELRFRHLILDGQQRLTSLAQAFGIAPDPSGLVWYLDVLRFEDGLADGGIEDAFVRRASAINSEVDPLLVPISALRSPSDFQRWRDQDPELIANNSSNSLARYERLNRLWVDLLANLREFEFPCSILPADMPLSAVATIFEKLNTAGLPLDTFDLVVAHVYRDGHNLRAEWESEVAEKPILRHFSPHDPQIAAELVAMVKLGDTRRSGLLRLDPEVLWGSWTRAISAIESAARFLSDRAGITNSDQLPHRGILLALAGAAFELGGLHPDLDNLLLHWVYSRGLSERFNAAVNTRVVAEYRDLVRAARGESLTRIPVDPAALISATRRGNSSIFLTVQAMVRSLSPVDFPDGLITSSLSTEYSRAFSLLRGTSANYSDRALGVILGSSRTEKMVLSRTLRMTRDELLTLDQNLVREFLISQMLPPLSAPAWDHAEAFLVERGEAVLGRVETLGQRSRNLERSRHSEVATEPTVDLVRDWLSSTDRLASTDLRLEVSKRVAEILFDAGKPSDAAATLQLLLESRGPWSMAERIGLALIQARALASSGLNDQALSVLESAQSDAKTSEGDSEIGELRLLVAAELASLLASRGQASSAIVVLTDAFRAPGAEKISPLLRSTMTIGLAKALSDVGDTDTSREVAQSLLSDPSLALSANFPELAEQALRFAQPQPK